MTDLTPEQRRKLAKIRADFQKKMEATGLGVTIRAGDREWVVTEPKEAPK